MGSIIFIMILGFVIFKASSLYGNIYQNIKLGRDELINDNASLRWKNVILIALGQKKMFKNLIPAIFHLFIYTAFLFTQIELIEIIIDGIFGTHRFLYPFLGVFYKIIIGSVEILSFLALIATIVFLYRRNMLKVPRLVMNELNGWPKLDANIILIAEIILVFAIFLMNGADHVLQSKDPSHYPSLGFMSLSSIFGFFMNGLPYEALYLLERIGWWLHVLVVFALILYLPISKHLHIFLAFPAVYFSSLKSRGEMTNMPVVMNEVKSMLGLEANTNDINEGDEELKFGACDVFDLGQRNILEAFACTECGRCTSQCPANLTGKKLSPRKIMMDVRDRATEVGNILRSQNQQQESWKGSIASYNDGKNLFSTISKEEIRACTTCNACVEACPILINPLDIIMQLRRYEVLTESDTAEEWTPMFTSLENSGAVWQIPQERAAWINQ
jgi:heterodisulfide reductase subunit C